MKGNRAARDRGRRRGRPRRSAGGCFGAAAAPSAIDLIAAVRRRPRSARPADVSRSSDVTLDGETKKAIASPPTVGTRITCKVARARRRLAAGVAGAEAGSVDSRRATASASWSLVSDGRASDELFMQDVNPFAQPDRSQVDPGDGRSVRLRRRGDRRHPQHLRQPAGQGRATCATTSPLWGAPEIVVRCSLR